MASLLAEGEAQTAGDQDPSAEAAHAEG